MAESPTVNWAVALRSGGREALGAFYRACAPRIYALACAYCRDAAAAEDAMQSAFAGLARALQAGGRIDNPVGYLVRAVRNRCASRAPAPGGAGVPVEPPDMANPLLELQQREQARRVWDAVALLPADQREAVYLHISAEMTFEEIARTVDAPLGTVLKRYYSALEQLKHKLKDGS